MSRRLNIVVMRLSDVLLAVMDLIKGIAHPVDPPAEGRDDLIARSTSDGTSDVGPSIG